jgi:hypothetical protein
MPVVTIRGKLGSWAPEIGKLISQKLQIDYIDREIIAEVSNRLHLHERDVIAKEMPPATLRGRIAEAFARGYPAGVGFEGASLPFWQIPLDDNRYLDALKSLIGELAKNKHILIYGRGSQFILRDFPHALHLSMVAPLPVRVKRIMESLKLDEAAARHEISQFDNSAREFIKRFFNAEMEDSTHYDLVINTANLSQEAAADVAIEALKHK